MAVAFPGVDIIEIARFAEACRRRPVLKDRLFTRREQEGLGDKGDQSWAVRFAGKEAVLKALGVGWGALGWHDIEILSTAQGEPLVLLSEKAQDLAALRGGKVVRLSLSHDQTSAVAMAILD